MERIFAIGDAHGCADELKELIRRLPLTADSTLVFLGDYVDRGPDSKAVVDEVLSLSKRYKTIALRGNHEDMLLQFMDRPESAGAALFVLNGGDATLASYLDANGDVAFPEEHKQFFRELRIFWQTEHYFFVHAGVPDLPLSEITLGEHEDAMLWIRSSFLRSRYKWEKLIVHGHSPVPLPENLPNRINVDTGCVFDGALTAVQLPERVFFSVPRESKAIEPKFPRAQGHPRIALRFKGAAPVLIAKGDRFIEFETLNYNQFGMLVRERAGESGSLAVGDAVTGFVGELEGRVAFQGSVVRTEKRADIVLYGIKLQLLE